MTPEQQKATGRVAPTLLLSLILAGVAMGMFAWIATEMLRGETEHFDSVVRNGVHSWASPGLTLFFRVITQFGSTITMGVLTAVISVTLYRSGHHRRALLIVLSLIGATILMNVLKFSFHRTRPEPYFGLPTPTSYSFPSGHALISFSFYAVLSALGAVGRPRWQQMLIWASGMTLILLIGLSRVYLGVHYPSDVVAGYLAASVWTMGVRLAYDRWRQAPIRQTAGQHTRA